MTTTDPEPKEPRKNPCRKIECIEYFERHWTHERGTRPAATVPLLDGTKFPAWYSSTAAQLAPNPQQLSTDAPPQQAASASSSTATPSASTTSAHAEQVQADLAAGTASASFSFDAQDDGQSGDVRDGDDVDADEGEQFTMSGLAAVADASSSPTRSASARRTAWRSPTAEGGSSSRSARSSSSAPTPNARQRSAPSSVVDDVDGHEAAQLKGRAAQRAKWYREIAECTYEEDGVARAHYYHTHVASILRQISKLEKVTGAVVAAFFGCHDRLDELYLHLDEDPVSGKHRRRVNFNAFVSRVLPSIDPVTFSSTVPEGASPKPPVTMSGMDWVGLINAGFNAFLDHERDKDQKVAIARKEREMEEKIKANDEQKEKAERRVRELEVQLAELRGREVAL